MFHRVGDEDPGGMDFEFPHPHLWDMALHLLDISPEFSSINS